MATCSPFSPYSSTAFKFRPATWKDYAALTILADQQETNSTALHKCDHIQELLTSRNDDVYVAEESSTTEGEKKIVGYIHVHTLTNIRYLPRIEIRALVVDKHFRRRGVGRLLLTKAVECTKYHDYPERVICYARTDNDSANQFYEKLGFQNTSVAYEYLCFLKNF